MLIASAPHPREQQRKKGKIMGLFDKFMKKKEASNSDECVLIHLDGVHLPDQVYQECDLSTLEDMLIEAIESSNAGELDGNEIGPTEPERSNRDPERRPGIAANRSSFVTLSI